MAKRRVYKIHDQRSKVNEVFVKKTTPQRVKIDSRSKFAEDIGAGSFSVMRGGKRKNYSIDPGYGYLISSFKSMNNLLQVDDLTQKGIPFEDIEPIINYLQLTVPQIAKAASVSTSTVSRWRSNSSIGVAGSNQFFRIDEIIKKGVELFGDQENFKGWLDRPNLSLGNAIPLEFIITSVGADIVNQALDALDYGNFL